MIFRVVPRRDRALWAMVKLHPDVVVRAGGVAWKHTGDGARCVYVRSGALVLCDGAGRATGVAGPGDLLGRGGGGGSGPRTTVEARALRASTIVPVPAPRVEGALRRGAATLPEVLRSLEAQIDRARGIAGGAGRDTAELRLARVLREAAERVGERDEARGGWVRVEGITHRILAEWAGLHRSTVTTILNGWLFDDVLEQEGRALRVPPRGALPGEGGARAGE